MIVVGAAFTADAARDAVRALAQLPYVAPNAIARAPLGAVGRASDGKVLVAVCIAEVAADEVARIVDQFGGQIVSRMRYPEPDGREGTSARRSYGAMEIPAPGPGRSDN